MFEPEFEDLGDLLSTLDMCESLEELYAIEARAKKQPELLLACDEPCEIMGREETYRQLFARTEAYFKGLKNK